MFLAPPWHSWHGVNLCSSTDQRFNVNLVWTRLRKTREICTLITLKIYFFGVSLYCCYIKNGNVILKRKKSPYFLRNMLKYTSQSKIMYVLDLLQNNSLSRGGGNGGVDETRLAKCWQLWKLVHGGLLYCFLSFCICLKTFTLKTFLKFIHTHIQTGINL